MSSVQASPQVSPLFRIPFERAPIGEASLALAQAPASLDTSELPSKDKSKRAPKEKATKIIFTQSARVSADALTLETIYRYSELMNKRADEVANLLKRWHDGGFGDVPGEDPSEREVVATAMRVAFSYCDAKFIVSILTHLANGDRSSYQSMRGLIEGQSRREPRDGPLEKAIKKDDTEEVAALRTYLELAERVSRGELAPFREVFKKLESEFEPKFRTIILNDAAEYLKGHVNAVKNWEAATLKRQADLVKLEASFVGKNYLAARERFFPNGLPRNKAHRYRILNNPELARWRKPNARFTSASALPELLEENKELSALVGADIKYSELCKQPKRPKWTPISADAKRYQNLDDKMFRVTNNTRRARNGASFTESIFETSLPVEDDHKVEYRTVRFRLKGAEALKTLRAVEAPGKKQGPVEISRRDPITERLVPFTFKTLRFIPKSDRAGLSVEAKLAFEKAIPQSHTRASGWASQIDWGVAPNVQRGDVVVSFVLDPLWRGKRAANNRIGWISVYGVEKGGARKLESRPVYSTADNPDGRTATRRGKETYRQGKTPGKWRRPDLPSAHGPVRGVTLRMAIYTSKALNRERNLLKLINDPERWDEAIAWCEKRAGHYRTRNKHGKAKRIEAIAAFLGEAGDGTSESPQAARLVSSLKGRIQRLKDLLDGQKKSLRNTIGQEVVRMFHRVREGGFDVEKELVRAIQGERRKAPQGSRTTTALLSLQKEYRLARSEGRDHSQFYEKLLDGTVPGVKVSTMTNFFLNNQVAPGERAVVLLIEKRKSGRGPSTYKPRAMNHDLAVLGASSVLEAIQEKSLFISPMVDAVPVFPKDLKKTCPSCGHVNARNPDSGKEFICKGKSAVKGPREDKAEATENPPAKGETKANSGCGYRGQPLEVAAYNQAALFFSPPARPVKEVEEEELGESESLPGDS